MKTYYLNFRYIGFELDKDYYNSSKHRIEVAMNQGRLF